MAARCRCETPIKAGYASRPRGPRARARCVPDAGANERHARTARVRTEHGRSGDSSSTCTHGTLNIASKLVLKLSGSWATLHGVAEHSRNTRVSRGMLLYRLVWLAVAVACVIAGIAGIVLAAAGVASVDAAKGEAVVS